MEVPIGVSARHIHLCRKDLDILFGNGYELTKYKDLSQEGEFASFETVSVKTKKSVIDNVRILGPLRDYTQLEISKTDSYILGINPPVRSSGDLEGSSLVQLKGPKGVIEKECCIIATRHIHINREDLEQYVLKEGQTVKIRVGNEKSAVLEKVFIKSGDSYKLELHIDLDDANANLLKSGDIGYIEKEE